MVQPATDRSQTNYVLNSTNARNDSQWQTGFHELYRMATHYANVAKIGEPVLMMTDVFQQVWARAEESFIETHVSDVDGSRWMAS